MPRPPSFGRLAPVFENLPDVRADPVEFKRAIEQSLMDASIRRHDLVFKSATDEGVVADGVVDVTLSMQGLVDAIVALGGGTLYLDRGTYLLDQLKVGKNVRIKGSGWGTIIKQSAAQHTVNETGTATAGAAGTMTDSGVTWVANEHAHRQVSLTGGTGSGQVRTILSNTPTVLTIGMESGVGTDNWTTNPDGTSTYEIITRTDLIVVDTINDEFMVIEDLKLDGNKANQTAFNSGIFVDLPSGSWTSNDQHILLQNIFIENTEGTGLLKGAAMREALIRKVWVKDAGRHSIFTHPGGGTDNMHSFCTSEGSALAGFVCNGDNDRWSGCKSFGSGASAIGSQGGGYLVTGDGVNISNSDAQENVEDGFYLVGADNCALVGIRAMSNDRDGVRFWDSDGNMIVLQSVGDESLPSGRNQVWAVGHGSNTNSRNMIIVAADSTHTSGIVNPSLEVSDNIILANGRYKNRVYNAYGALGGPDEHFAYGKATSPTTNDPQFVFKTDGNTPPLSTFEGYDGSTTKQFFEFDYGNARVRVGQSGTVHPLIASFTDANRGAAGTAGRIIFNTDDGQLNVDDGTNWTLPDGTITD